LVEQQETRARRVELLATILLALAAVATAWCSYQASRWNGEQAKQMSATNGIRIEAARSQGLAQAQTQVDVATFIAWVDAFKGDDAALADFYFKRFRPEFKPAVNAWLATKPLENANAPPSPFAMPEYRLAATTEAERLDAEAETSSALVHRDIQRATDYVLGVVLFASALFFAGISTKLRSLRAREVLLALGWTLFLATAAWIATSPVSFSV
jgi:TRAP-type C4-dicarboxylate transport system permease small subunit